LVVLAIGWIARSVLNRTRREPGPRPEPRIDELKPGGAGSGYVGFNVHVANYGTRQCRCEMSAWVGEESVECRPQVVNLIPDTPPELVMVLVPRPRLGDLVSQFAGETTLYGEPLQVEAVAGEHKDSKEWREKVYTPEENAERHRVQQRVWRIGRGEETEQDRRSEHFDAVMRERARKYGGNS
jgi:hypothetical protein